MTVTGGVARAGTRQDDCLLEVARSRLQREAARAKAMRRLRTSGAQNTSPPASYEQSAPVPVQTTELKVGAAWPHAFASLEPLQPLKPATPTNPIARHKAPAVPSLKPSRQTDPQWSPCLSSSRPAPSRAGAPSAAISRAVGATAEYAGEATRNKHSREKRAMLFDLGATR